MRGGMERSMNKEEMHDYYGQPDEGGFIRLHSYDLQQLVRNGNASYNMLSDINKLGKALMEMERERDRWRTVAKMMIAQVDPESPAWAEYWKVQRGEQ